MSSTCGPSSQFSQFGERNMLLPPSSQSSSSSLSTSSSSAATCAQLGLVRSRLAAVCVGNRGGRRNHKSQINHLWDLITPQSQSKPNEHHNAGERKEENTHTTPDTDTRAALPLHYGKGKSWTWPHRYRLCDQMDAYFLQVSTHTNATASCGCFSPIPSATTQPPEQNANSKGKQYPSLKRRPYERLSPTITKDNGSGLWSFWSDCCWCQTASGRSKLKGAIESPIDRW